MRRLMLIGVAGVVLAGWLPTGQAVPEPALVSATWELDFEYRDPQRMVIKLPGDTDAHTYWYMVFTITNNTGQDLDLIPSFELVTDTLQTLEANLGVPTGVFEAIKKRHKSLYPFLAGPMKVYGRLLQGEDNAKDCVAIWPQFDMEAKAFDIYVGGLSGEQKRVVNPAWLMQRQGKKLPAGVGDDVPQFFNLQKTLQIEYKLPGDPANRPSVDPARQAQNWVIR